MKNTIAGVIGVLLSLVAVSPAMAYTRTPSENPAEAPITFDVSSELSTYCSTTNWKISLTGPSTTYRLAATTGTMQEFHCDDPVWRTAGGYQENVPCPVSVSSTWLLCTTDAVGVISNTYDGGVNLVDNNWYIIEGEEYEVPTAVSTSTDVGDLIHNNLWLAWLSALIVFSFGLLIGLTVMRSSRI